MYDWRITPRNLHTQNLIAQWKFPRRILSKLDLPLTITSMFSVSCLLFCIFFLLFLAVEGAKQRFKFFGSKNEDLSKTKVPKFTGETSTPVDGVLMLQFDEVLRVGDTINYKIHVDIGDLGYRREGLSWTIEST